MKLGSEATEVQIGEAREKPRSFEIARSKEAFKILSSGLYNDKILAIIRELCCNAYDAHVAAGKGSQPFELHLPTQMEPYFTVKDYGVGLSHDDVMELYCTYFSTNKSNSNAFVGALGLGSKSPFCYTEGFTVISYYNGKKSIYSAYIAEDGTPAVILQDEENTKDGNGLEVTFPVKLDDCWEFENKARIALEFFDPLPTINLDDFHVEKTPYIMKEKRWALRHDNYTHHTSGLRAIQGMVQYAVGNIDQSRMSDNQRRISDMPLDLFFDIGELSVAASREALSNDERTIGNILSEIEKIHTTLIDSIKSQVGACKTRWEARLLIYTLIRTDSIGKLINDAFDKGVFDGKYPNFDFSRKNPTVNESEFKSLRVTYFRSTWRSDREANKDVLFRGCTPDEWKVREKDGLKHGYAAEFSCDADVAFILNDLNRSGERYIHYFLQGADDNQGDTKKKKAYLFGKAHKDASQGDVLRDTNTILAKIGDPPLLLLSALKEKYKPLMDDPTEAGTASKRDVLLFDEKKGYHSYGSSYGWTKAWKEAKQLPAGKKYYVPVKSLKPTDNYFRYAQDFNAFIENVRESKLFSVDATNSIYGLTEGHRLKSDPDWINFNEYIFTELKNVVTPSKELDLSLLIKHFDSEMDSVLLKIAKEQLLSKDSQMQKFCDSFAAAKKMDKKALSALAGVIKRAEEVGKYKVGTLIDFKKAWETVKESYPLLNILDLGYRFRYGTNSNGETIINYIRLVDKELEEQKSKKEKGEQNEIAAVCVKG